VQEKSPNVEVLEVSNSLSKKFRNADPKEFTTTAIHVLCSNFTEIGGQEVVETMGCFGDNKFRMVFSAPFCARFAEGAKSLRKSVPATLTS